MMAYSYITRRRESFMKRFALSVALAVSIVAPAGSQQPRQPGATAQLPDSAAAKNQSLEAQIVGLERQSWEAVKNKDYTELGSLMTAGYHEIDMDGRRNKTAALDNARNLTLTNYSMSDVKLSDADSTFLLRCRLCEVAWEMACRFCTGNAVEIAALSRDSPLARCVVFTYHSRNATRDSPARRGRNG